LCNLGTCPNFQPRLGTSYRAQAGTIFQDREF
jgi:hypothetical protein